MAMEIISRFIDIIFPPKCPICLKFLWNNAAKQGDRTIPLCHACFEGFTEIRSPLCPVCRIPFASLSEEDHLCEDCLRKRPFFDALGAPYRYQGSIMEAIHQLKYVGKTYLVEALGPLLASFARDWLQGAADGVMMPVPLHPKRLRERRFNQSLLLARCVASELGLDLDFLTLRRVRYTRRQTGLKSDERRRNVRNAFELVDPGKVRDRTVILVDDVATTGSTLNECARVLKRSGCDKVVCLALARTVGVQG